jgi:hypothetical protein
MCSTGANMMDWTLEGEGVIEEEWRSSSLTTVGNSYRIISVR